MENETETKVSNIPGLERLGSIGLVGERKAVALLCLGFYTTLFFMISLSARTELPEWLPVFASLTAIYITAFMAVAAEWFWGRWFATGLGYWGMTVAVMAFVTTKSLPAPLVIFGIMHALISVCLMGDKMAGLFDAQPGWRERWNIDEQGVIRVRKSVTRAASSLPALIMFALAPREGGEMRAVFLCSGWVVVALATVGLFGLLRRRVWSLFALAGAGVLALVSVAKSGAPLWATASWFQPPGLLEASGAVRLLGLLGGLGLIAASLPFLIPTARYLLTGRR